MIEDTMISVNDTQLTPLSFLERSSRVWAETIAIVHDGRTMTYAEFGSGPWSWRAPSADPASGAVTDWPR